MWLPPPHILICGRRKTSPELLLSEILQMVAGVGEEEGRREEKREIVLKKGRRKKREEMSCNDVEIRSIEELSEKLHAQKHLKEQIIYYQIGDRNIGISIGDQSY